MKFEALSLFLLPLSVISRPADVVGAPDRPYEWGGTYQQKEAYSQWQRCSCTLACREGGLYNDPSSPCYGSTGVCDGQRGKPICGPKQMMSNGGDVKFVNQGQCDASSPSCQWQQPYQSWVCYDCPSSYIAINNTCPPRYDTSAVDACIGCRYHPEEVLVANKSETGSYGYSCVKKGPCKMNDEGLDLLKDAEKFCPQFYDSSGHKTVGYGHDCCVNKDCGSIKTPITEAEATKILQADLADAERCICNIPGVDSMTINQFSSYVDFAYNAGCGSLPYTDKKGKFHRASGFRGLFRSEIASQSWTGICSALPATATTSEGKPLAGLRDRRNREAKLCREPTDTYSGCPAKSKRLLVEDDDDELELRDLIASRTERLEPRAPPFPYCTKHPWTAGAASYV